MGTWPIFEDNLRTGVNMMDFYSLKEKWSYWTTRDFTMNSANFTMIRVATLDDGELWDAYRRNTGGPTWHNSSIHMCWDVKPANR